MDPIYIIGVMASIITAVVIAGRNRVWVWGWVYDQVERDLRKALLDMTVDRDFWRDTTLELLRHTKAVEKGIKGKQK